MGCIGVDSLTTLATSDAASNLGSLLGGLAAVGAVALGWYGFDKWRRELRGTTKFHAVRRVLRALYRLEVQVARTRSDWYQFNSLGDDDNAPKEPEEFMIKWRREYADRLVLLERARWRLHLAGLEAKALLKEPAMDTLTDMFMVVGHLKVTAEEYFRLDMIRHREGRKRTRDEKILRLQAIVYSTEPEDEFEKKVAGAVKTAETWYRQYLR